MSTTSDRKRSARGGAAGKSRASSAARGKGTRTKKATGKAASARARPSKATKGGGRSARAKTTAKSAQKRPAKGGGADEPRVRDHLRDAWAVGCLIAAALAALGLYADAAGVVGLVLASSLRGLFGVLGYVVPVALAVLGGVLLRDPRPGTPRVVIGVSLTGASAAGLWHLAQGGPAWDAPVGELHAAGGWLGATVAVPLQSVAALWGSVVLLAPLLVLGVLIATATPPRTVVRRLGALIHAVRDRVAERRARRDVGAEQVAHGIDDAAADEAGAEPAAESPAGEPTIVDGEEATAVVDEAGDEADEAGDGAATAASDTQLLPRGVGTGGAATRLPRPPDDPWADYELPELDLLRTGRAAAGGKRARDQMTRALEHTLRQFGVDAHVGRISSGPTVTRFELQLGEGVRVGAVTKLVDDISYALATPEIRIVAPIPGKSAIGIEVPNRERGLITLGDVLRSPEADALGHPLGVALGVDIAGNPVMVNLASMPHLLIAGATGSGKSVTMNGIVTSVLMRASPAEVRMILVDPKRVELNHYEGAPHLLTPVVTDPKRATEALDWTVKEMEQRYERLAMLGYRNIDAYNAAVRDGTVRAAPASSGQADRSDGGASGQAPGWEPLPYMLFIIDELADLMMIAPREVENHVVRIAQMARAVGIHLIVATQRPSVDVVTGLIKANVPSRVALAMATQADSRTILDQGGAEKLVGHGDMLFMPANASKPHRIQGCFVDEAEIEQVVARARSQREPELVEGVVRSGEDAEMADLTEGTASDNDLTRKAMDLVVRSGLGSTSMLQRKLKVGFARAGRIMDELEELGVVGPSHGSKARDVLMTVAELEGRADGHASNDGSGEASGGGHDGGEHEGWARPGPELG